MKSAHWTIAGVRHRGLKWYWVRYCHDGKPTPVQMYYAGSTWFFAGVWAKWCDEWERWSEPIAEPVNTPKKPRAARRRS